MQLSESNFTVRCHGSGSRARLTVAVDASAKIWLLPDDTTEEGEGGEAKCSGLLKSQHGNWLEAMHADDLSHRAKVQDLLDRGWKQLAYGIRPPEGCSASSSSQPLYIVPATGQVLCSSGSPVADQQSYLAWLVPGVGYWSDDAGTVEELTVAELIKAFADCKPSTKPTVDAGGTTGQEAAAAPGHASSSCMAAKRKAVVAPLEQGSPESSTAAQQRSSRNGIGHNQQTTTAAEQVAELLASTESLNEQRIQRMLQMVLSGKCSMQQMLEWLQQRDDQQVFMAFACAAISEGQGGMLLAALAAAHGRLMQHFLQSLSSSKTEVSAAAVQVLTRLAEVAHGRQFITAVVTTEQGAQLLSRALLAQDSSTAVGNSARVSRVWSWDSIEATPAAGVLKKLLCRAFCKMNKTFRSTSNQLAQQCINLLTLNDQQASGAHSYDEQWQSDSSNIVAVATLLLLLIRGSTKARAALESTVQPLLIAAADLAGPRQLQCVAALQGMLVSSRAAFTKLTQCDLAPLLGILAQQGPAAGLAASILQLVVYKVEPADTPRLHSQLAQAATTSSTAAGSLAILCLLTDCGHGGQANQEGLLLHLDAVLHALAQVAPTTAWHNDNGRAAVVNAIAWLYKLASAPTTKRLLTATQQRAQQLAALVLHAPHGFGSRLGWFDGGGLGTFAAILVEQLGGAQLLALQCQRSSCGVTNTAVLGAGSSWLESLARIVEALYFYANFVQSFPGILDSIATIAQCMSDQLKPASVPAACPPSRAVLLSLAELESLGTGQRLLQALRKCTRFVGSDVAVEAFRCLRFLAAIPAYACAAAGMYQELESNAKQLRAKIPDTKHQLCLDDLAAVKSSIIDLQQRIATTTVHAKSELELAMRDCALEQQKFRRDTTNRRGQLLFSAQLQRVTKAVAYDSKAREVQVVFGNRLEMQRNKDSL